MDPLDLHRRALFHSVGCKRHLELVGLRVARSTRRLVHRRGEQAAALGREVEVVADSFRERQRLDVCVRGTIKRDDRPALRLQPDGFDIGKLRDMIRPGAGSVHDQRS